MTSRLIVTNSYKNRVREIEPVLSFGRVQKVVGTTIIAKGPHTALGDWCRIKLRSGRMRDALVVGFQNHQVVLMAFGPVEGIGSGDEIVSASTPFSVGVGDGLLGRVLDGLGQPIDGMDHPRAEEHRSLLSEPPPPLTRASIREPFHTGIPAIDGLLTIGRGQRVGIFSGSGVGKSTLLGNIVRNGSADVNVIALIGERGRELKDFLEKSLGPEGLRNSVVVSVMSNESAALRISGAYTATTIAEYFRDRGANVLLMMDSLTRVAMAQREIGLGVGEPPTTRGYPPSVFAMMPKLLERAGTSERGSITGIYSILIEADDMNDPVGDSARSILDGHIVLSRALAAKGHYPPVDVLRSVSRTMPDVVSARHLSVATRIRSYMAEYEEIEDLINLGGYKIGMNPEIDQAVRKEPAIRAFLRRDSYDSTRFGELEASLQHILEEAHDEPATQGTHGQMVRAQGTPGAVPAGRSAS